jgi:hypothetical protein
VKAYGVVSLIDLEENFAVALGHFDIEPRVPDHNPMVFTEILAGPTGRSSEREPPVISMR